MVRKIIVLSIGLIIIEVLLSGCISNSDTNPSLSTTMSSTEGNHLIAETTAFDVSEEITTGSSEMSIGAETSVTTQALIDTIDWDNPKLTDLFDVDKTKLAEDEWLIDIDTENVHLDVIIELIGKPHGIRPGHPDTLVWMSNTGKTYGLRFIIAENEKREYKNSIDQMWHSISAFPQPVFCAIDDAEAFPMNELPIHEISGADINPDIPWQDQFFDLKHDNKPSEELLNNFHSRGMLYEDVVSFLGKPHAILLTEAAVVNRLVWISDEGNYYALAFDTNVNPNDNMFPKFQNSRTSKMASYLSHPYQLSGEYVIFDGYKAQSLKTYGK